MVLEIAQLQVDPAKTEEFKKAMRDGVAVIRGAKGFISAKVHQQVENPAMFILAIEWERIEDHTEVFRPSPEFQKYRSLVGPYFVGAPTVAHYTSVPV